MSLAAIQHASAAFAFKTDNNVPSPEDVEKLKGRHLAWQITPVVQAVAQIDADLTLSGIEVRCLEQGTSVALNEGAIELNAHVAQKADLSQSADWGGASSFKAFDSHNDGYVELVLDESCIAASAPLFVTGRAYGLYGVSGQDETTAGSTEAARSLLSVDEGTSAFPATAPPYSGTVVLVNTGTIKIKAGKDFSAAGIAAKAVSHGTVIASNLGTIDLSEAEGSKHQLLADLSGNGRVLVDDWVLKLADLEDGLVPFGIISDGDDGRLGFTETAVLWIVPSSGDQLDKPFKLGPLVEVQDADDAFHPSTSLVEGGFARIEALSEMLSASAEGSDLNDLAFTIAVQPKEALGARLRTSAFDANMSAFLSIRELTAPFEFQADEGWRWEAKPWRLYSHSSRSRGFTADGGGIVLRGGATLGPANNWLVTAYSAAAHENLDGSAADSSATRAVLGAALVMRFSDNFSAAARVDWSHVGADWTLRDRYDSAKTDADSSMLYGEVSADLHTQILKGQTVGGNLSAGWLRMKGDGFSLDSLAGHVRYEDEAVDTGVLSGELYWKGRFESSGYTVMPRASLSAAWLTDPDFETRFDYLGKSFTARGKLDRFYGAASLGAGFGKGSWSLHLMGSQRWSANLSSRVLSAAASWRF